VTWAGIVVCADLSPAAHICDIATTAQKRANLVLRAFISRDVNTLVRAYLVYVRPLLEYNSIVWSPDTVKDIAAVMYTVLSSLAACGRLGVAAAAAGVFVCHA